MVADNISRLSQSNAFSDSHLGFKGIFAGISDELIPEGYVPDMENLKITQEGIAAAIPNPTTIAPPDGQTALTSMFVWQKDDGTDTLLAQYGAKLYKRVGTPLAWVEIERSPSPWSIGGGGVNLLTANQSNAETDLTGVSTGTGTLTRNTVSPMAGAADFKLVAAGDYPIFQTSTKTAVVAGNWYSGQLLARESGCAAPRNLGLNIVWYTAGEAAIGTSYLSLPLGTTATVLSLQGQAPATATQAILYMSLDGVVDGEILYADNLMIEEYSPVVFGSTKKASYAAGMNNQLFIAQEDTQCMSYDGTTLAALWNGPKGRYITLWKNRLWVGYLKSFYGMSTTATSNGTETTTAEGGGLQSTVVWSNINLAEVLHDTDASHFDNGWSPLSMIALKTPENSVCTGILPAQETLLMFTASAVFKFSGYSETTFTSFNSYNGADTPKDGAVITAGGVFYVSGDGFFLLSALKTEYDTPKKISEAVKPLINLTNGVVSCANFDGRVWFCTGGTLVALNSATGAWEKYKLGGLYGATDVGIQNIVYAFDHLYVGTSTGYILEPDVPATGYRSWYLQTPTLNQGITTTPKRYTSLFVYARNTSDTMYSSYSADRGNNMTINPAISGITTGDLWGAMLWGAEATTGHGHWSLTNTGMMVYRRLISLPLARTISFMFTGTGDGALLGYSVSYRAKRKTGV